MKIFFGNVFNWVIAVGVAILVLSVAQAVIESEFSPPEKFSTECVASETMVVKSDKTRQFEVFYSEDCK